MGRDTGPAAGCMSECRSDGVHVKLHTEREHVHQPRYTDTYTTENKITYLLISEKADRLLDLASTFFEDPNLDNILNCLFVAREEHLLSEVEDNEIHSLTLLYRVFFVCIVLVVFT